MRWIPWLALMTTGCFPAARRPLSLPPSAQVHRWVDEANARLDSALRTTNPRHLEAELDPRSTIVMRGRDRIVGAEAVVRALRAEYPEVGEPSIFMHADERELCVDGACEYLGTLGIQIVAADRRPRYADFRYAAKWESDGERVRLVRLALYPSESEHSAREALCSSRGAVEYPSRRLVLTFMPGPIAVQENGSRSGFWSQLGANGLLVSDPHPLIEPGFTSEAGADPWGVVAARVRLGMGASLELFWGLGDQQWNAQASATQSAQDRLSYVEFRSRPYGVLAGYEWVGAYSRPLAGDLVAELRLQHTFGLVTDLPSIAGAPVGRVDLAGTSFGFHLGGTLF